MKISDTNLIAKDKNFQANYIFNCAGLFADVVAENSNLKFKYSFLPFKGKYWKISFGDKNEIPNRLIYPVPNLDQPFLGVHTVYDKDGNFYLGPSSTPVFGREAYRPFRKFNFLEFDR